jgi:hypothetical protein
MGGPAPDFGSGIPRPTDKTTRAADRQRFAALVLLSKEKIRQLKPIIVIESMMERMSTTDGLADDTKAPSAGCPQRVMRLILPGDLTP